MFRSIGIAHVGYLPKDRIPGLSKLGPAGRVLRLRQFQVQERLTEQIVN